MTRPTKTVTSELRSVFDDGPDGVLVSDAEPNIDSLLQQGSSSVPLSMSVSFDDPLDDSENGTVQHQLLHPLSVVIRPMPTPTVDRVNVEDDSHTDPIIDLFPSPHPSFEEGASIPLFLRMSKSLRPRSRRGDLRVS